MTTHASARPRAMRRAIQDRISKPELLRNMDAKAVEEFIADDLRTKAELIELGTMRFSIPRSNLMRMRISDVRAAISAALLHEKSIQVIGDEAIRSGTDRKS